MPELLGLCCGAKRLGTWFRFCGPKLDNGLPCCWFSVGGSSARLPKILLLERNGLAVDVCCCIVLGTVTDVVAVVVLLKVGAVVVGAGAGDVQAVAVVVGAGVVAVEDGGCGVVLKVGAAVVAAGVVFVKVGAAVVGAVVVFL
jgi:hypothetical protein